MSEESSIELVSDEECESEEIEMPKQVRIWDPVLKRNVWMAQPDDWHSKKQNGLGGKILEMIEAEGYTFVENVSLDYLQLALSKVLSGLSVIENQKALRTYLDCKQVYRNYLGELKSRGIQKVEVQPKLVEAAPPPERLRTFHAYTRPRKEKVTKVEPVPVQQYIERDIMIEVILRYYLANLADDVYTIYRDDTRSALIRMGGIFQKVKKYNGIVFDCTNLRAVKPNQYHLTIKKSDEFLVGVCAAFLFLNLDPELYVLETGRHMNICYFLRVLRKYNPRKEQLLQYRIILDDRMYTFNTSQFLQGVDYVIELRHSRKDFWKELGVLERENGKLQYVPITTKKIYRREKHGERRTK